MRTVIRVPALLLGLAVLAPAVARDGGGDLDKLLDRVNRAMRGLESYRVSGTFLVSESPTAPELLTARVTGSGRPDGDGMGSIELEVRRGEMTINVQLEVRTIDGIDYMKDPTSGEWMVVASSKDDSFSAASERALEGRLELSSLTAGGAFIGNAPVIRLEGDVLDLPGEPHVQLWVGDSDHRIRKIRVEGNPPADEYEKMLPKKLEQVYQLETLEVVEFNQPLQLVAPELGRKVIASPHGAMFLYESEVSPVTLEFPAHWGETATQENITIGFASEDGGAVFIAEEDLVDSGFGKSTLEGYVEAVRSAIESQPGSKILGARKAKTVDGRPVQILNFTLQGGFFQLRRLVYLHDERYGFNATFLAPRARFDEIEKLIDYCLKSLRTTGAD